MQLPGRVRALVLRYRPAAGECMNYDALKSLKSYFFQVATGLPWRSSLQVADSFVQDGRKYGTTNSLAVILSGSC